MNRVWLWLALALCLGCSPAQPVWKFKPSFYYWKTTLHLNGSDQERFKSLDVQRLYIRFFDLDWDPVHREAVIIQALKVDKKTFMPAEVVPVVFLTRNVVSKASPIQRTQMAKLIVGKVGTMARAVGRLPYPEFQMDFDWTPTTKGAYFDFLKKVRVEMKKSIPGTVLAATIRLHQVKYMGAVGVPPVDRGILMVYHTSSPTTLETKDTILDVEEAKSYLHGLNKYPLDLDVALPMFSWAVQFNTSGHPVAILQALGEDDFSESSAYEKVGRHIFRAIKDTFAVNQRVMAGDLLKVDEPNPTDLKQIIRFLKPRIRNTDGYLIMYNYDVPEIRRFTHGDDGKISNLFAL